MSLYKQLGVNPTEFWGRLRAPLKVEACEESRFNMTPQVGLAVFTGLAVVGASVGATIGTYVFFGTVTFIGLVALIEQNPRLKWIARRSSRGIDIFIFVASVAAMAKVGVTVAASLTFAGLAYTLIYSPYLRIKQPDKPKTRYWAYRK